MDPARVSLLRWLQHQLAQPFAGHERLEAAVQDDDPAGARRLVAEMPLLDAQRKFLEELLGAWERQKAERS